MMLPPRERQPDDPRLGPVMLRGQLLASGYTDKAIARLVRGGDWVKIRHGAYTLASIWAQLDASGRHGLHSRAVLAQARTPVVLSHVSGLAEYDAPTWGLDLSDVHVTRLDGKAGRNEAGVNQHSGLIVPGDVVRRNGVPVMSPTRLALEVSMVTELEPSLVVVNHLLHAGLTTHAALAERYQSMNSWPFSLKTDLVLRLGDGRIESVGETRTFGLCFRHSLPMPTPQYEIRDASGRVVARVDFAWPELGVFLEFDGMVKYEKLLEDGQRASDVVVAEKRREELICRLTGWRCIRLVWSDLAAPERTAAMIRRQLYSAAQAA